MSTVPRSTYHSLKILQTIFLILILLDSLTTFIAVTYLNLYEINPFLRTLMSMFGTWVVFPYHIVCYLAFTIACKLLDRVWEVLIEKETWFRPSLVSYVLVILLWTLTVVNNVMCILAAS